jgi:hypothetical protein
LLLASSITTGGAESKLEPLPVVSKVARAYHEMAGSVTNMLELMVYWLEPCRSLIPEP